MTKILVVALVLAAAFWASRSWRRGLEAALVLLVLEGAVRKWLIPGAASYVYFAKDLLLLGVYWGFLQERGGGRVRLPPPLVVGLALSIFVGALQIFNPRLPTPLVGILGFKAYFLYVPLLFVVPHAYRSEQELLAFCRRYLRLAIPIGLLAILQFVSPPDSRWNTYAKRSNEIVETSAITFGAVERVRVTGTFSFITGYSSYLQVISLIALTVLSVRSWRLRRNLLGYMALAFTVAGMLMTGSRGPVFLLLLIFAVFGMIGVARQGGLRATGRFLLGLGLVASVVNVVGADAVAAFRARAAGTEDVVSRIVGPFVNPIRIGAEIGVLGYGIGASHQMAEVVATWVFPYSWLEGYHYEDEPSRIMVELGVLGFAGLFLARAALAFAAFRALMRLRRPLPRAIALSALLLFLSQFTGGVVFNVTGGVYYWFFGGLLLLAERLDRQPVAATAATAAPARGTVPGRAGATAG